MRPPSCCSWPFSSCGRKGCSAGPDGRRCDVRAVLTRMGPGGVRLVAALLAVVGVFAVPLVLQSTFTIKILTFAGINVIIVIGLALLFGYAGQISLGHAGFFGLGAYTSAILTTPVGLPGILALSRERRSRLRAG